MKIIILFLAILSAALAQTPSLATYKSGLTAALSSIRSSYASVAQPKINLSAHNLAANTNWLDSGQATCNPLLTSGASMCGWDNINVINAYTDALVRGGAASEDENIDVAPLAASTQYSGSLTSDCAGGAGLALNATPPAGSGWNCGTLANFDSMFAHAAGKIKIRWAPFPSQAMLTACGITSSSTEANLEACIKPLYVAAAARWGASLDSLTVMHEAVGAWGGALPMTLTTSFVNTFVTNCATAIHAASAAVKVGAAAETMFSGDLPFWNSWMATSSVYNALDFFGIDFYSSSWDVTTYVSTAVAQMESMVAQSLALPKPVRFNEAARPSWVASGAYPTENNAIEGSGDIEWSNDGLDVLWQDALMRLASSIGVSSFTLMQSPILIWYTSNTSEDNVNTGTYMAGVLAQLTQTSLTGTDYVTQAQWANGRLVGRGGFVGHVTVP
jgi:hypothetical protein